jgi:hypothetical protein
MIPPACFARPSDEAWNAAFIDDALIPCVYYLLTSFDELYPG